MRARIPVGVAVGDKQEVQPGRQMHCEGPAPQGNGEEEKQVGQEGESVFSSMHGF